MSSYIRYIYSLPIFVLIGITTATAQQKSLEKANAYYQNYAFIEARNLYLETLEEGFESAELYSKLADTYYLNSNYKEASKWYGLFFTKYPDSITHSLYRKYDQSLRAQEKFDEINQIKKYIEESVVRDSIYNYAFNDVIQPLPQNYHYELSKLEIANSEGYSDFAPFVYSDTLYFSSNRPVKSDKIKDKWSNKPYFKIFKTSLKNQEAAVSLIRLSQIPKSTEHQNSAILTSNGDKMYITLSQIEKSDKKRGVNTIRLKLYLVQKNAQGAWGVPKLLPFNGLGYSVSHPAISRDGKTLYFASDRPGSLGESDIWKVAILDQDTYGEPVNLGPHVNTSGRESFPSAQGKNSFYYASDGIPGMGGLDLYFYDGESQKVYSLDNPINSSSDDFSLIFDTETQTGYFASNRNKDNLDDEIYAFTRKACTSPITILVVDESDNSLEATVTLFKDDKQEFSKFTHTYSLNEAYCNQEYSVQVAKEGFLPVNKKVVVNESGTEILIKIVLEKEAEQYPDGLDLAYLIEPILFDYDSAAIREDAALELNKIISILKENPKLHIEIKAHTDSRGRDAYNLNLSDRRAKAMITYLINKGGIKSSRISGKGYGETQLKNQCANGIKCSDAQHQENRRSEFIVTNSDK